MQEKQHTGQYAMPIVGVVIAVLAMLKLGLQLWGLNKGYDITDEGLYILMMNFSEQYPTEPHNYYTYILTTLLPFKTWDLLLLRRISLVVEITGISYFALAVYHWLKKQTDSPFRLSLKWYHIVVLTFMGAAFLSVYPRAFSYNDFSYFNTLFVAGTVLLFFSGNQLKEQVRKPISLLILVALGGVLGAQLIIKFSTSLLLLFWVPAFLWLRFKKPLVGLLMVFTALLAGAVLFLMLFFQGLEGFNTWIHNLDEGVKLLKLLSYDLYGIFIQGYLKVDILENAQYYTVPLLVAFTVNAAIKRLASINPANRLLVAYIAGLCMWFLWSSLVRQYFLGAFYYRFIAVHIYTLLFLGFPILLALIKEKRWPWIGMVLLLAILPFVSLIGSNNPITQTLTRYLGPWAVLTIIFLCTRIYDARILQGFLLVMITINMANYVTVQIYHPYALSAPLTAQNHTVEGMHYVDGIQMDKPTAAMFGELLHIAQQAGYKPGGPVLALGDLVGVATGIGGYIPETFWYFSDESATSPQHARNFSCIHLGNLRMAKYDRFPLLVISEHTHQQVLMCLTNSEIPYPESYHKVGTVFSPYRQENLHIWAPKHWESNI